MSRTLLAEGIITLFVVAVFCVVYATVRYQRYRRSVERGNRRAKPVWRPFWMS